MAEECTHDCSNCSQNCDHREPEDLIEKLNPMSGVRHVYGIVSGKGGVGKSIVTAMLAVAMQRRGLRAAVLDADITGPSIPKMFGVTGPVEGTDDALLAKRTRLGTQIMSVNLLLGDETKPVVWRGPIIAGTVKQFWTDVIWDDVDYMFVDMPPGTGDVPLTVFQSLPLEGIFIVTAPQELVSMVVEKAANMAALMKIPVVGIIENMSYFKCPDCGKEHKIFGESHIEDVAARHGFEVLGRIPLDPALAEACDEGAVEMFEGGYLDAVADRLIQANR